VGNLLKNSNASVLRFIRYEVGEGIEKKEENFADEVMKQIKGES
jgi:elongation factor Ts